MFDAKDAAAQLSEDSVAFVGTEEDAQLARELQDVLGEGEGVVITGGGINEPRNAAQDVLNVAEGFETIIIRTPERGTAVSDVHTRVAIESAHGQLSAPGDFAGSVAGFLGDMHGFTVPWLALTVAVVVVAAAFIVWTWISIKDSDLTGIKKVSER
ncbi:hypothetical protein C3B44_05520 [Corynebacterium yudongzhengii]|nr:DUF6676 family protein [Corynebacterium yudongzhengii]AWB81879.1 hypothetical protein C3B44_05520 [Corynebacterium yudongzhengii]